MVENWNSANKDILYGKADELTGDDREHVEVSALALHIIQAAITYLNTITIQIMLSDPAWNRRLTDADRRGLSAQVLDARRSWTWTATWTWPAPLGAGQTVVDDHTRT